MRGELVIVLFLAIASVIFYLSIYGYLHLIVNKLSFSKPARIALWLVFVIWVLAFMVIEGMVMQIHFQEYHKAFISLPIALGFAVSVFRQKALWQQFNKMISS